MHYKHPPPPPLSSETRLPDGSLELESPAPSSLSPSVSASHLLLGLRSHQNFFSASCLLLLYCATKGQAFTTYTTLTTFIINKLYWKTFFKIARPSPQNNKSPLIHCTKLIFINITV